MAAYMETTTFSPRSRPLRAKWATTGSSVIGHPLVCATEGNGVARVMAGEAGYGNSRLNREVRALNAKLQSRRAIGVVRHGPNCGRPSGTNGRPRFETLKLMEYSLETLRSSFLQEAQSVPKLFRDLAKVEQYIAEGYKTRAFIELIQNADAAQADCFGVHELPSGLAAGNDGRPFTYEDLEALCRSGASHKHRGGKTIGYRGIGFKSVVNLAKTIFVFSGEYAFFFNKDATKSLFADVPDVPLIRIPHPLPVSGNERLFAEVVRLRERFQYNTLFIFQEFNERLSAEEFSLFDRSSLLFCTTSNWSNSAFTAAKERLP